MKRKVFKKGFMTLALALLFATTASAFTAVTSGNWSSATTWGGVAPGGTVSAQDIDIPAGITVTLDMNVTFNGVAVNTFAVNGTLNGTSTNSLTIAGGNFAGSGAVDIFSISFTNVLSSMSYTGNLIVDKFRNSGATLILAAVVTISDTLNLDAGTMVLNSGSNVSMLTNSTVRVNNGTIAVAGGIFNSSSNYNVLYVGISKATGIEVNTVTLQNMYIQLNNNTQTLTLGGNLTVNGDLHHTSGKLDFTGRSLTLKGDLTNGPGVTMISTATSNLTMQGTIPPTQGLMFASGSVLNDLTINYSSLGNVTLSSTLAIAGNLKLINGGFTLGSGSNLIMNAGSNFVVSSGIFTVTGGTFTGSAAYNAIYNGTSITTGPELNGSGLNNLTINTTVSSDFIYLGNDLTLTGNLALISGRFIINGNKLILNGTFDQSPGTYFYGSASGSKLEINTTSTTVDTLTFANPYGELDELTVNTVSQNLVLGGKIKVKNLLSLLSGKIELWNSDLTMEATGTITGYSNIKYIVTSGTGRLKMNVVSGSTYVTFPVGSASNYSPAAIQQTASATSGSFAVRVFDGVLTNGTSGFNTASIASVVDRTWMIDTIGTSTVNSNIRLGWVAAAEVNGFDRTQSYISHYTGGSWDSYTLSSATTGPFTTFESTRTGITSLSPFSVADINAAMSVNEKEVATGLNLYPNPSSDYLYVEIGNSTNSFKYDLVDLTGKVLISISNNNNRNTFDVSQLNNGCYFIKVTNLDNKEVITKRFIKG